MGSDQEIGELRKAILHEVWSQLQGDYACTRVWEAWQVGTMSEEDFEPLEDTERAEEITDAVIRLILADRAEHERKMQSIPHINGTDCPACGHPTLILGNGGYITCSLEGCSNPDYQEALELKLSEHERKARIDEQLRTRLKIYDDGTSAIVFRQSEGLEIEQDLRVAHLNQLNNTQEK